MMTRRSVCSVLLLAFLGTPIAADEAIVETVLGTGVDVVAGPDGKANETGISQPFGITIGPDGALYVCEVGSHVIRRVDLNSGLTLIVAGNGTMGYSGDGGPARQAQLNEPYEVRFDSHGNMLFVEMKNHIVRKVVAASGKIQTVAGTGMAGFSGDGGPATMAQLKQPHSIALDSHDQIYICDIQNHRIRVVDAASGLIHTWGGTGAREKTVDGSVIGETPLNGPRALDYDGKGRMILALREGNALFDIQVDNGRIRHLAGNGKSGYTGDGGPAKKASLAGPKGVALSKAGDIYFADTESHTVRVYRSATQTVETVIGDGIAGDGPDGAPKSCRLNRPHGVYVSADGWLYVGDSNNHRVRRMRINTK